MREIIAGDTGRHGAGPRIDAPVIIPYRRYAAASLQLYDFICMSMAAPLRDLCRGRGLEPLTPCVYEQLCQLVLQVICGLIDSRQGQFARFQFAFFRRIRRRLLDAESRRSGDGNAC